MANVFLNQTVLTKAGLSPLNVIDKYNFICDGSVKANFYGDCAFIPDPSELNVEEKNLLILDDCFLGQQNKAEAYYKGDTIIVIHFTYHKTISVYHVKLYDRVRITYTLTIVMMICLLESLRDTVEMCGVWIIITLLPLI